MFIAKMLAMIVIVLETDLGELARIEGEVWRNPCALATKDVFGIECARIAICPISPEARNPTWFEAPQDLRIKAPIAQSFSRQCGSQVRSRFDALIQSLGLP